MKKGQRDFTGLNLFDDAYSYHRPSSIIANSIMNALMDSGFTDEQALHWIYSKSYRHLLDGKEHLIENLIYKIVKEEVKEENPASYNYETNENHLKVLQYVRDLNKETV
jgi:hypothetical protein